MIKVIPDLPDFEKAPVFCWSDPVQKKKKKIDMKKILRDHRQINFEFLNFLTEFVC